MCQRRGSDCSAKVKGAESKTEKSHLRGLRTAARRVEQACLLCVCYCKCPLARLVLIHTARGRNQSWSAHVRTRTVQLAATSSNAPGEASCEEAAYFTNFVQNKSRLRRSG